jgi:phage FluMu protein Com
LLQGAESILPDVLELQDFDTTPFSNAWMGISSQSKELIYKIEQTWHDKVSSTFAEADDINDQKFDAELNKGLLLMLKLEKDFIAYEIRTFGTAARKLQQKAQSILGQNFMCSQCHAPLEVKKNFFRSYYVNCPYCKRVNTFEPGTIARNMEHFAYHALSNEEALAEYLEYYDLYEKQKRFDDLFPDITREKVIEAYKKYIEKYLKTGVELIPEYQERYDKDHEAKMKFLLNYY